MTTDSSLTQTDNAGAIPVFLTIEQVAKRIYVGRSTAYNMVNSREIPSIRFGRLIRVPASALDQYIASKLQPDTKVNK